MTNEQAWAYAATWGSFITNGDPGACMYGFDEKFLVQDEAHRAACLAWIDNHCVPAVKEYPKNFEPNELAKLAELRAKIARDPNAPDDIEEFFEGMINCALWSSTDSNEDENDDTSFAQNDASEADLSENARRKLLADATAFVEANRALIVEENFIGRADGTIMSRAGHDFWLTRCGHGAGFWDGDWKDTVGDTLTAASKAFDSVDLYRSDDRQIHI